jgi:radical SAM superfamily enzyme YgiQ (UPF0313 family)
MLSQIESPSQINDQDLEKSINSEKCVLLLTPHRMTSPIQPGVHEFPIRTLRSATILKKQYGYHVKVTDLNNHPYRFSLDQTYSLSKYHKWLKEFLINTLHVEKYRMFGLKTWGAENFIPTFSLAKVLKEINPNNHIVVAGLIGDPKDFKLEGSPIDTVIFGEPELTLGKAFSKFTNIDTNINTNIDEKIKNTTKFSNEIIHAAYIPDINKFPKIDYSIYPFQNSPEEDSNKYNIKFSPSRGCPNHCTFCAKQKGRWEGDPAFNWRAYDINRIIDEMKAIRDHFQGRQYNIHFYEHLWGGNDPKWRQEMLKALINLNMDIPLQFSTRIDMISDPDLELMSQLPGKVTVHFGMESASPTMLKMMKKTEDPAYYVKRMQEIRNKCEQLGIYWRTFIIIGHPGETKATLNESLDYLGNLLEGSQFGLLDIHPFYLLQGSEINDNIPKYEAQGSEFLYKNFRFLPISIYAASICHPSKDLSYREVIDIFLDWADKWIATQKAISNPSFGKYSVSFLELFVNFYKKLKNTPNPALEGLFSSDKQEKIDCSTGLDLFILKFWKEEFDITLNLNQES